MNLEDFEFSTRFLMQGKKTQYASDALVYQEAIAKAGPFIRYRSRARRVQRLRHQPHRLTLAASG
ncbi:hypothetical protein ACT5E2_03505 [Limosilactobacillus mucosae]|uniref:hypothetical protein n=1 Tax=Limosilactobacillus mucosae TaxID=97478 RepID=UPI00053C0A12